jgi:hypothetical protein
VHVHVHVHVHVVQSATMHVSLCAIDEPYLTDCCSGGLVVQRVMLFGSWSGGAAVVANQLFACLTLL